MAAAIRVLAKLKPEGAAAALLDYLPSAGEESLAEGVRLALAGWPCATARPTPRWSAP